MKLVKQLMNDISGNIEEAMEKIKTAYSLKDTDRQAADWYKHMAEAHLRFNEVGLACVNTEISNAVSKGAEHDPLYPGMVAVYRDYRADLMTKAAEVQVMISTYK